MAERDPVGGISLGGRGDQTSRVPLRSVTFRQAAHYCTNPAMHHLSSRACRSQLSITTDPPLTGRIREKQSDDEAGVLLYSNLSPGGDTYPLVSQEDTLEAEERSFKPLHTQQVLFKPFAIENTGDKSANTCAAQIHTITPLESIYAL